MYIFDESLISLRSLGTVKVFNESLICIFECTFDHGDVKNIKLCSTSNELNPDQLDQTLFIQYAELCVRIDALQLISLLRQNESKLQTDQPLTNNVLHEIWYFKRDFIDFVYCGLIYESIYDNLVHQSLFTQDSHFRFKDQRTIKRDLLVTVGHESFLNFYDLNKNESKVTIKGAMTSLVSNFLFGSSKQDEPQFTSNNATLFFSLNKQTVGNSVVLSPNRCLALAYDQLDDSTNQDSTDRNSTVSLIDLKRRELIRSWKGYRNCQFSFIEINNSLNKGEERALFVCLYLPESRLVEIWPSRFDDKIVSIDVGANCVLISNQNLFKAKHLFSHDTAITSTILFDFETLTSYTFDISFLCAVTDYKINSRDDLLLKEIPRTINDRTFKKEDLEPILKKLRSPENKLTILKMMFEKNDLDLIEYTVNSFQQLQLTDKESNTHSIEERSLLNNCKFVTKLSELYTFMNEKNSKMANCIIKKNILKETPLNITEEAEHLKWKETDFTRIIPLFIFSEHLNPDDLQFELPILTIQEFMSFFNLNLNDDSFNSRSCNINLKQESLHKLSTFLFSYLILEEQDLKLIDYYIQHSISALDLIYLLFHAWSANKFTYNWKTWKSLLLIAFYLVDEYEKEIDNEQLFRRNLINCLKQACRLFLASSFIQSAIVGTYTIQVIYNLFCNKYKQTVDYYTTNEDDEWVEISLDEESFSSVLKQLEDIYLLNLLLQCGNSEPDLQISLIKLVKSKNSLTGELVAVHCVRNLIDANVIANLDTRDEDANSEQIKIESNFKTEIDRTLRMLNETDEDLFSQLLRHTQLRFPCNLNISVLLAHCAWQSILKFITSPSINNQVHLQQCLNYLDRIKDPVLKHKMALLIWRAFLTEKFSKINKIIFDEKNWNYSNFNDDLGIEEFTLEPFVLFISDFVEFIFNTINEASNAIQPNYRKDEWWMPKKNKLITVEDQQKSIIEVALSLRVAKHNVTLLHSHLALLTNLTINFKENMITSLKTCFPQTVTCLLYSDLHIDLNLDDDNEHLKKCRERILKKFTQNIGRNVPVVTTRIPNDRERECFREANSWISKLIDLAQDWNIDSKLVRTNYVFMLYFIGCDVLAKEGNGFSRFFQKQTKKIIVNRLLIFSISFLTKQNFIQSTMKILLDVCLCN